MKFAYAIKKLQREKDMIEKDEESMISVMLPDESNLFRWDLMIEGPADTVFEGGVYLAKMTFPNNYPNDPPKMVFSSPIFHPNIYPNGEVAANPRCASASSTSPSSTK